MAEALTIEGLDCFYGAVQVLRGVGAGAATRRGAVPARPQRRRQDDAAQGDHGPRSGRVPARSGSANASSRCCPRTRCRGPASAMCRRVGACSPSSRVGENLTIGLMARGKGEATRDGVLALFPVLGERIRQRAGTLSGGEQQMLAMARALCLEPEVLLARRADGGSDAVDDRDDPARPSARCAAAASPPSWSSSASRPCCRWPTGSPSSKTAAAAKRCPSRRCAGTRHWSSAMSASVDCRLSTIRPGSRPLHASWRSCGPRSRRGRCRGRPPDERWCRSRA